MNEEKFCPTCEDYRAFTVQERTETYTVRGLAVTVPVTVEVCDTCHESLFDDARDNAVLKRVYAEYRAKEGLLTPDEIKDIRSRWRLSQKSLAALLGMSEATLNRYEQGSLQDRVHDEAIRSCRNAEVVRDLLTRHSDVLSQWQRRNLEGALSNQEDPARPGAVPRQSVGGPTMPQEITDRTGFRRFDYSRYAAVIRWFCQRLGRIAQTKLYKLLFYTDFVNFRDSTVSLTGAAYEHRAYGPVPVGYEELRGQMEAEGLVDVEEVIYQNGHSGEEYGIGATPLEPAVQFTPGELAVLEFVSAKLGNLTPSDISELSHKESAWRNTVDREVISYREAATLSLAFPR